MWKGCIVWYVGFGEGKLPVLLLRRGRRFGGVQPFLIKKIFYALMLY